LGECGLNAKAAISGEEGGPFKSKFFSSALTIVGTGVADNWGVGFWACEEGCERKIGNRKLEIGKAEGETGGKRKIGNGK